jgi:colanic acid biosynthesis glycosyl transferase WcaI
MGVTRVCVLAEYFYPDNTGGSGTILSKLMRELRDTYADLEVDVITSNNLFRGEAGSLASREDWDGIRIHRLSTPQPRKNSVKRRLAANLLFTGAAFGHLMKSRARYDVVLVVTAPPTLPLAAKMYATLTRTPYIYLVYDLYLDMAVNMGMVCPDSRAIKALKKIQTGWFRKAAKTVVLGRCMRDHVGRQYGVPAEKMSVIPIPSNADAIVPMDKSTRFRKANDLRDFVVLYAGNFAKYQDFETLLDAAKQLDDRRDITFVFVGDGNKKEYIQSRIAQDKLTNVRLLPFVPEEELSDMLASADVSLVTLERGVEGLAVPSKFYNIMASGRATVAIVDPASEIAHVINEAHCGLRVEPEDPAALAQAIARLADSPETLKRMGRNARRVCEEKYSLQHVGQQFYDVFHEVVKPPSGKRWMTPALRPLLHTRLEESAEYEYHRI